MSFPTSNFHRNNTAPLRRQNTREQFTNNQAENDQKGMVLPTRRNYEVAINNIESIRSQIGQLLSVVKNKSKNQIRNQLSDVSNQRGYLEYKKQITNLEQIQQAYQLREQELLPATNALKYHQKNVYEKKLHNYAREIHQPVKFEREILQDKTPISRPSGAITPPKVSFYSRNRSPALILRPNSKYINENYVNARLMKEKEIEHRITNKKEPSNQPNQPNYVSFNRPQQQLSQKPYSKEVVQKIEKDVIRKQKHLDIKAANEPQRPTPRYTKQIQTRLEQRQPTEPVIIKNEVQPEQDYRPPRPQQQQREPALNLRKLVTFNEKQHEAQQIQPQEIVQISPQRKFELKVYPCDLDKETIRSFIADRLANVIKIDKQFIEMKKIFMFYEFRQRLRLPEKKLKLLRALWNRGLMIDQADLEQTIKFDVDASGISEKRVQYQNFTQFIEAFVDKYLQAQYEWEKKVFHMLTENEIHTTYFKAAHLDLENKGYLRVENLACFVNLYASDSPCFSNKQVEELFSRFCRHETYPDKLSYEGFLNVISREV